MESPDLLEQRIRVLETALGIAGYGAPATLGYSAVLPVGSVYFTKLRVNPPLCFGTWEFLATGSLLGEQIGTVYAWQRTA